MLYNEDCLDTMLRMKDENVDMVLTSPPYGDLRIYNGFDFDFDKISTELFRVLKDGGVVVWVVGDKVIKGSESGVSFRQALKFMEVGFRLHDTMIYMKDSISFPETNRYNQIFEYMFVLSKGKPKTTNIIKDRKNIHFNGRKHIKGNYRKISGETQRHNKQNKLREYGARFNVWRVSTGCNKSSKDKIAFKHPAIMPESLAGDHILSWSNEGDIVYDPFMGSGTTAKMAILNNREWVGSEISLEYCEITKERINNYSR